MRWTKRVAGAEKGNVLTVLVLTPTGGNCPSKLYSILHSASPEFSTPLNIELSQVTLNNEGLCSLLRCSFISFVPFLGSYFLHILLSLERGREDNIKMDLKEIGWVVEQFMHVTEDRDH